MLLASSSLQRQAPGSLCALHHCQESIASESRDDTAEGILPVNWLHFPTTGKMVLFLVFFFFSFSIQEKKHLILPINRKKEGISVCLTPEGKKQPFERKVGWGFCFLNHNHLLWVSRCHLTCSLCISFCSPTRPTRVSSPFRWSLWGVLIHQDSSATQGIHKEQHILGRVWTTSVASGSRTSQDVTRPWEAVKVILKAVRGWCSAHTTYYLHAIRSRVSQTNYVDIRSTKALTSPATARLHLSTARSFAIHSSQGWRGSSHWGTLRYKAALKGHGLWKASMQIYSSTLCLYL